MPNPADGSVWGSNTFFYPGSITRWDPVTGLAETYNPPLPGFGIRGDVSADPSPPIAAIRCLKTRPRAALPLSPNALDSCQASCELDVFGLPFRRGRIAGSGRAGATLAPER